MRLSLSSKKVGNNSNSDSTREKIIFQGLRRDLKILHGQAAARWARCESVRGTDQGRVRVLQSDLRTRCATARTRYTYPGCSHSLLSFRRPLHGLSLEFQSAYLPIVSLSAVFRNSTRRYLLHSVETVEYEP